MAKSGKKRKRQDKAKTQLKKPKTAPGKHLPKGTNVTKTEFRVKQIVIPSQLKRSDQSGPLTKKKLGLKDVLSKLAHFSQAVRADGLDGLRELVTGDGGGSLVSDNLSTIVEKVAPLTQDREAKLRSAAASVLESVVGHVSPAALEPLHGLLAAHLCCGLSHIDPSIQLESLKVLDSLVSAAPDFVAAVYDQLLPNCLAQISGQSSRSSLSTAVSERMSALKLRTEVLQRLHKVLQVACEHQQARTNTSVPHSVHSFSPGLSCRLYSNSRRSWLSLTELTQRQTADPPLLKHIHNVMPLLLETWIEATATGSSKHKKGSELSPQVLSLLQCEVGVIDQLVNLAKTWEHQHGQKRSILDVMESAYLEDFTIHFVSLLPYSVSGCQQECNTQNVLLGQIYLSLASQPTAQLLAVLHRLVVSQLAASHQLGQTVRLTRMLLNCPTLSREDEVSLVILLANTYATVAPPQKPPLLELLLELTLTGKHPDTLENWQHSLWSSLCTEGLALNILDTCLTLAKRGNCVLLKVFEENRDQHLDWSETLEDSESSKSVKEKLNFINFYCQKYVNSKQSCDNSE